jgi:Caspase domain
MQRLLQMKALFVFLLLAFSASAQNGQPDRDLARRIRRLALVIGNDAYPGNPLHNAVNDARSMRSALEDAGFTVQLSLNATQQQMETVIDEFTGGVHPGDIALFFYAGHGLQISDQNYLIPVDFQARTAVDAKYKAYPAQRVQENLEAAGARMQILILDACRNNPFRSLRGGSDGLAAMQAGKGTYIAFATSPGKTAADNPGRSNGLFTGELITVLRETGLSIDQVFNHVRARVSARSHGEQLPWSTSSVTGEFYFKATIEGPASIPSPPRDLSGERELAFWNSIKDEGDPALLEEYLRKYPAGEFASIARSKLNRLKAATALPPPVVSPTLVKGKKKKATTVGQPAETPAPETPAPETPTVKGKKKKATTSSCYTATSGRFPAGCIPGWRAQGQS